MFNKLEKKMSLDEQLVQVRKLWKNYDAEKRIIDVSKEGPGHFSIQLKSVNQQINNVQYSFTSVFEHLFKTKG